MNLKRLFQCLIIASLLMVGVGTVSQSSIATANAQPQLAQMAAEKPGTLVRVIVQEYAGASGAEAYVTKLGGRVVTDLHIINAFAAEMTAGTALELARNESVRWVSLDAPVQNTGKPTPPTDPSNTYLDTLRVRNLWSMGIDGSGVGVAIIDSGITTDPDFTINPRSTSFATNSNTVNDIYGHGTHVAGIIAGNGNDSSGKYMGIAPGATLYSVKIADGNGMAYESDVVAGLQWVYDNKATYNIRVVNISLNTMTEQSYHASPMDAAVEILWFNKVVVVVSAGNYWSDTSFNPVRASPANDPFVITVGATDEKGTTKRNDDVAANFSSFGTTSDGYFKPDIYAPGKDIVSVLSSKSSWSTQYPDRVVSNGQYIRLSGTSMSAPMVTGVVALLLQDEPNLTPDQVKYRLINTAPWLGPSKYLDAYATVTGTTTQSANQGIMPSLLLSTGPDAIDFASVGWNTVGWNTVGWNTVGWNTVGWNTVGWNTVGWNSTFWGP